MLTIAVTGMLLGWMERDKADTSGRGIEPAYKHAASLRRSSRLDLGFRGGTVLGPIL